MSQVVIGLKVQVLVSPDSSFVRKYREHVENVTYRKNVIVQIIDMEFFIRTTFVEK